VLSIDEARDQLDQLDTELVRVLARRSRVVDDVVQFKKAHAMPAVDPEREREMLHVIESVARSEGLDPRIAKKVLRSVIDAFTIFEVEELGPGHAD
jgi:chorismate mutase